MDFGLNDGFLFLLINANTENYFVRIQHFLLLFLNNYLVFSFSILYNNDGFEYKLVEFALYINVFDHSYSYTVTESFESVCEYLFEFYTIGLNSWIE